MRRPCKETGSDRLLKRRRYNLTFPANRPMLAGFKVSLKGFMRLFRKRKQSIREGVAWAPRALAVISCALALLAAQPAMGTGAQRKNGAVMLTASGGGQRAEVLQRAPQHLESANGFLSRDQRRIQASPRLHILATVEILQRLLAAELRPVQGQLATLIWFSPFSTGVVALPVDLPQPPVQSSSLVPTFSLPTERAFAIAHCLLAPPLS
jgi:hypothetical protein